jgi:hypothetical protein
MKTPSLKVHHYGGEDNNILVSLAAPTELFCGSTANESSSIALVIFVIILIVNFSSEVFDYSLILRVTNGD